MNWKNSKKSWYNQILVWRYSKVAQHTVNFKICWIVFYQIWNENKPLFSFVSSLYFNPPPSDSTLSCLDEWKSWVGKLWMLLCVFPISLIWKQQAIKLLVNQSHRRIFFLWLWVNEGRFAPSFLYPRDIGYTIGFHTKWRKHMYGMKCQQRPFLDSRRRSFFKFVLISYLDAIILQWNGQDNVSQSLLPATLLPNFLQIYPF